MLSIGVLGINFKTASLDIREAVAAGVNTLCGERALFFPYPTIILSTCNRVEIYFSAPDLAIAHSYLLAHLRQYIESCFEQRCYSYFGIDCFAHLCRVTAGLDSAIVKETEIQGQVKKAYHLAPVVPSVMHYVFQKALKVGKWVRNQFDRQATRTLYDVLWEKADWNGSILLVGYSQINRGLLAFLEGRKVGSISLCTRSQIALANVAVLDRSALLHWQQYDVIVCASQAEEFLICGDAHKPCTIFDLGVPRNVDPQIGATLYNIDQLHSAQTDCMEYYEALVRNEVAKLAKLYWFKTQHVLESVGTE